MSELKHILQWVTITKNEEKIEILHQFEEDKQLNIKRLLDLSENDKLDVMIGIPVQHRIDSDQPIGNPFIGVDMRTGQFNINGTSWNFMPQNIDPLSVKFRPIWFHSIDKQYAAAGGGVEHLGDYITQYKIGWQFTHEKKNYQRIIFYNITTGEFSIKERR